jgi:hypothetical protein
MPKPPLSVDHDPQQALPDDEFLIGIRVEMLPARSREHSAAFQKHVDAHLVRAVIHVDENEGLAVKRVTNPGAWLRKSSISLSGIAWQICPSLLSS